MKLLSIAIPCYNSQSYMRKCVESLLSGGDDVEIIIVNDGSKDETASIAEEYAVRYPSIVKTVHQENGGYGEAVNAGLIFFVYRFFSSQRWERQEENNQFCKYIKLWKLRYECRKEYRIYLCKRCGRFVRVPKGKVQVTCTACGAKMMKRT